MSRGARLVQPALGASVALALVPAAALADHHEISVREVFPGSTANPAQDYVELQMYAPGQNLVGGHSLTVYDGAGQLVDTATFPSDVADGASQRTILVGAASSVVGTAPDLVASGLTAIDPAGGAVCWNASPASFTDCVSWGAFTGSSLPNPAGTPAPAITDGSALRREIGANCPTALDPADDTDDSEADFSLAAPAPRNNATTPSEQLCVPPDVTIRGPRRTTDRTPTFRLRASEPVTFRCRVDDGRFRGCSDPFTTDRLKLGRHRLKVKAKDADGEVGRASRSFEVVRRR